MTCDDYKELLSAYVDRALHGDERTAVQSHLDECQACRVELGLLIRLKERLRAEKMPSLPPEVISGIESETLLQSSPSPRARWNWSWAIPTLTVAAALGAWMLWHFEKAPEPRLRAPLPIARAFSPKAISPEEQAMLALHRSTPSLDDLQ